MHIKNPLNLYKINNVYFCVASIKSILKFTKIYLSLKYGVLYYILRNDNFFSAHFYVTLYHTFFLDATVRITEYSWDFFFSLAEIEINLFQKITREFNCESQEN